MVDSAFIFVFEIFLRKVLIFHTKNTEALNISTEYSIINTREGPRYPSEIVQPIWQIKRMSQHLNKAMLSKI